MANETYVIRKSENHEAEVIRSFIEEHYTPEAVILQGFLLKNKHRITDDEKRKMAMGLTKFLETYTTFLAVHEKTKEISGAIILYPQDKDFKPSKSLDRSILIEEFEQIIVGTHRRIDFYNAHKNEKLLRIRMMTVHKNHRGRGLAKILLNASLDWAKNQGFQVIFSFFTYGGSQGAAKSIGFENFMDVNFSEYKDANGSFVFDIDPPNNIAKLMYKQIQ